MSANNIDNYIFKGSIGNKKKELQHFFNNEKEHNTSAGELSLCKLLQEDHSRLWLLYSVLTGKLPTSEDMTQMRFLCEIGRIEEAIDYATTRSRLSNRVFRSSFSVRVVTNSIFVDVHHTSRTSLSTGIQKVVRETVKAWSLSDRNLVLSAWSKSNENYQALDFAGTQNMGLQTSINLMNEGKVAALIPWRSHVVLPELAIEPERTSRLLALAEFSDNKFYGLGFDCIPVTTAETVAPGMASAYANYLSVFAHAEVVAPISIASGREFTGWRNMLKSRGISGPRIKSVVLPGVEPAAEDLLYAIPDTSEVPLASPLVLCVGSHEPRKNHLNVLFAAERLWLQGHDFSLVFIGGNSWNAEEFDELFDKLTRKGRKLFKFSKASDAFMQAMYVRARVTVFPSLNEGFGLPITESLACGVPCITSNFGSMAEIALDGGCITIDPRNTAELSRALLSVITDESLHQKLTTQAKLRPQKNWREYADELWSAFFE